MASTETVTRVLGSLALERGLVTEAELLEALDLQRETGQRLGEILVEHFGVARAELSDLLAEQWLGAPVLRPPSLLPRDRKAAPTPASLVDRLEDLRERVALLAAHVSRLAASVERLGGDSSTSSEADALRTAIEAQSERIEALERAVVALADRRGEGTGLTALARLVLGEPRGAR